MAERCDRLEAEMLMREAASTGVSGVGTAAGGTTGTASAATNAPDMTSEETEKQSSVATILTSTGIPLVATPPNDTMK